MQQPSKNIHKIFQGPCRVYPGGLSVTRAFGDIEAKDPAPRYGGNPDITIAEPEIKEFEIEGEYDFLVMGSDGVFSKLSNERVCKIVWETFKKQYISRDYALNALAGQAAINVMKGAAY